MAQLRAQVLGQLSRVEVALDRAIRETARTASLTAAHRTGLAAASGAVRKELAAVRAQATTATTVAALTAVRRRVPVTAPLLLAGTTRVVASADSAVATALVVDQALVAAVERASAAGKDVRGLQAEVDAARAAAAQAGAALVQAADALVASAGTPSARPLVARAHASVLALTGALKGRTGTLRELTERLADLPEPAPTEPAPTEPAPVDPIG